MLTCKVKSAEQETIDVQDVLILQYPAVSWWARRGIFKSGYGVPQGPVRGHLGVLFNTDTDFYITVWLCFLKTGQKSSSYIYIYI